MKRSEFRPRTKRTHGNYKVRKVMEEYEAGTLKSHGKRVRSRKQAIAIALSEQRKYEE